MHNSLAARWVVGLGILTLLGTQAAARAGVGAEAPGGRGARPARVVVWGAAQPQQKPAYDNFLGNAIADHLKARPGFSVRSVKLDDPEQGLSDSTLEQCDVLVWWGHVRHKEVTPETAKRIVARVKAGK